MWCDLGAVGKADVGHSHGAKQNGIGASARLHDTGCEVTPGLGVIGSPAVMVLERQRQVEAALQRRQHPARRDHHLLADAVARQHRDLEPVHVVRLLRHQPSRRQQP